MLNARFSFVSHSEPSSLELPFRCSTIWLIHFFVCFKAIKNKSYFLRRLSRVTSITFCHIWYSLKINVKKNGRRPFKGSMCFWLIIFWYYLACLNQNFKSLSQSDFLSQSNLITASKYLLNTDDGKRSPLLWVYISFSTESITEFYLF